MNKPEPQEQNYIENIIIKTGKLLPAFHMAYQNREVKRFIEFIKTNKLQETFLENAFNDYIDLRGSDKEKKCFMKIVQDEGMEYLKGVYGEQFGSKLDLLSKAGKLKGLDICELVLMNKKGDISRQANIMCEIIDLFNDDNLEIGIHRTGALGFGDSINAKGLLLTGHISSGVDSSKYEDIYSKLTQNISFENTHIGLLMQMIATGGNYKNYMSSEFVDISLIAIPKKDLIDKKNDIIIDSDGLRLNPKYVKGYVRVNANDNTMVEYVENPRYIEEKRDEPANLLEKIIEKSKEQLGWSSINRIVQKIKLKINNRERNQGEEFDDR